MAKEWYRFPSNFFVPDHLNVQFVKSQFGGQLPKYFESDADHPTRIVPKHMNDANREEPSRYVNALSDCHYMIDTDYPEFSHLDQPYAKQSSNWKVIASHRMLDSSHSPSLYRAFYIPLVTPTKCSYINYNILVNVNLAR